MSRTIDTRWFGTLTAENIEQVAAVVGEILKGRFAIAEAAYCDQNADLKLISGDCSIDSQWTSAPTREPVRVFPPETEGAAPWFGFSAGGFLWMFTARNDGGRDHDNYTHPYFSFDHDKFVVTVRSPAKLLFKRGFMAHHEREEDRS